ITGSTMRESLWPLLPPSQRLEDYRHDDPASYQRIWNSLRSRILYVVKDYAGQLANGKVRHFVGEYWLYTNDAGGYKILTDGDLHWLNLVEDMPLERKLDMSLAELGLSVRATDCLKGEGITKIGDLIIRPDEELLEIRNFRATTLTEVKAKLAEH